MEKSKSKLGDDWDGIWDGVEGLPSIPVDSYISVISFHIRIAILARPAAKDSPTYLLRNSRPRKPPNAIRQSHPPYHDAQINNLIPIIRSVLIGMIQRHQIRRLQPLALRILLNIIGQDALLLLRTAQAMCDIAFQLPLQGAHLLLDLRETQLARLVQLGT